MPESRIIEVRWSEQRSCFVTDCPLPCLLHVCFESRGCALEQYKKLEVSSNNRPVDEKEDQFTFRTYIDYSRDTLFPSDFGSDHHWAGTLFWNFISKLIPHTGVSDLQHISFDTCRAGGETLTRLASFARLKSISLVAIDHDRHFQYITRQLHPFCDWNDDQPLRFQNRKMMKRGSFIELKESRLLVFRNRLIQEGMNESVVGELEIRVVIVERRGGADLRESVSLLR